MTMQNEYVPQKTSRQVFEYALRDLTCKDFVGPDEQKKKRQIRMHLSKLEPYFEVRDSGEGGSDLALFPKVYSQNKSLGCQLRFYPDQIEFKSLGHHGAPAGNLKYIKYYNLVRDVTVFEKFLVDTLEALLEASAQPIDKQNQILARVIMPKAEAWQQ